MCVRKEIKDCHGRGWQITFNRVVREGFSQGYGGVQHMLPQNLAYFKVKEYEK